jgi:adenylate cyclase
LALASDLAEAHAARGFALTLGGSHEEANREFETALRLNPKLYEAYLYYGNSRFAEGKSQEAAELYVQASAVRPEDYQALALAGLSYAAVGNEAAARDVFEKAFTKVQRQIELYPDDARALYMGAIALCRLGRTQQGLDWGSQALALDPEDAGVLYNIACLYSVAGRTEPALDLLERAVQNGFGHREWIEHDPDFVTLRDQPRFRALIDRL